MKRMVLTKLVESKKLLRTGHKKSEHFLEMFTQIIITNSILPYTLLKD